VVFLGLWRGDPAISGHNTHFLWGERGHEGSFRDHGSAAIATRCRAPAPGRARRPRRQSMADTPSWRGLTIWCAARRRVGELQETPIIARDLPELCASYG
jgi:hypothetical protein